MGDQNAGFYSQLNALYHPKNPLATYRCHASKLACLLPCSRLRAPPLTPTRPRPRVSMSCLARNATLRRPRSAKNPLSAKTRITDRLKYAEKSSPRGLQSVLYVQKPVRQISAHPECGKTPTKCGNTFRPPTPTKCRNTFCQISAHQQCGKTSNFR